MGMRNLIPWNNVYFSGHHGNYILIINVGGTFAARVKMVRINIAFGNLIILINPMRKVH